MIPAITGTRPAAASTVAASSSRVSCGVERMALAGAAAGGKAVDALPDQPVDLPLDQLELQLAVGPEWGGHRRDDAAQLHRFLPASVSIRGCLEPRPIIACDLLVALLKSRELGARDDLLDRVERPVAGALEDRLQDGVRA